MASVLRLVLRTGTRVPSGWSTRNQVTPCFDGFLPVATLVQMTGESGTSRSVSMGPHTPRSRREDRLGRSPSAASASMSVQSAPSIPITTVRVSVARSPEPQPPRISSRARLQ